MYLIHCLETIGTYPRAILPGLLFFREAKKCLKWTGDCHVLKVIACLYLYSKCFIIRSKLLRCYFLSSQPSHH